MAENAPLMVQKAGKEFSGGTPGEPSYTEAEVFRKKDGRGKTMDRMWSPWRYTYVTTADATARPGVPELLKAWPGQDMGCVFCNLVASVDWATGQGMERERAEEAGNLVWRGEHCFICLNAYPYTNGHVMVIPYAHLDRLSALPREAAHELIEMGQLTERALEKVYHPHGFNFGMNLGRAAGAGVAGHLHLHGMPRWEGDTNFMTTVAETRVLPESLESTRKRLKAAIQELGGGAAKREG